MPTYSHSQLSTFEECPLKYKLHYVDRIKRDTEGVEAFLGSRVHEVLKKCYDDARLTRVATVSEMTSHFERLWEQNWNDSIVITKKDLGAGHYQELGRRMLRQYHERFAPFNSDMTIRTEMWLRFKIQDYSLIGIVDRLARTRDGVYHIHDYKTGGHLPDQQTADDDRQLGMYQIGVQKSWPSVRNVRLVWHYLAFDTDLVSARTTDAISDLENKVVGIIREIESTTEFKPNETGLCGWCEYPDLCPMRKHFFTVDSLPANKYLCEPGVSLVNRYAELTDRSKEIEADLADVKEALIDYARRENVVQIRGSDRKVRVKLSKKLKFPGKNDPGRKALDSWLIGSGKWMEVCQLDTTALTHVVEKCGWDSSLIDEVKKFGSMEETAAVYLSKIEGQDAGQE